MNELMGKSFACKIVAGIPFERYLLAVLDQISWIIGMCVDLMVVAKESVKSMFLRDTRSAGVA